MEPTREKSVVLFGTYQVSFQTGEVWKAGLRIRVQHKPLHVLEILLEHPGEVVSREELRNRVWPDESFGDFDQAVNIAVAKLRTAFGDSAENPRFIETIPKRGYRFIAEVSRPFGSTAALANLETQTDQALSGKMGELPPEHRRWPVIWATAICLILLGVFIALRLRLPREHTTAIRSLAVLPLDNFSGDPSQDYFADGMTDQLITDLAQIRALRVISRTSVMGYRGQHRRLPEIARELNVDAVVEGSVQRSGIRVRITAQLIKAATDQHLWAQTYEGDLQNALTLQDQVARDIAEQVRVELTPSEEASLDSQRVVKPEAYEAYLKGRYFWNKRTADGLELALDNFKQAIAIDPEYPQAYSGLADTYALLGDWQYAVMSSKEALPKAKAAAQRAVSLNDKLSEAHISLAFCLEGFDWNFEEADREFRRALELNPGYATGHQWYAWHLSLIGRNQEALIEMRKAQNLDPLSLIINADLAELLLLARQPDASIEQSRRTIEMDANFPLAHNQLAQAYMAKGRYADAIKELQGAVALSGGSPAIFANMARAYAATNRRADAVHLLNELKQTSTTRDSHAPEIASIYVALGDKEEAMAWLEKGYEERFNPGVLERPAFDPLRSDSRFQDLIRRIGLPGNRLNG